MNGDFGRWIRTEASLGLTLKPLTTCTHAHKIGVAQTNYSKGQRGKMKKILLVDDQANFTMMMAMKLKSMGYTVFTAENGSEALTIAAAEVPDLIVMDIMMPVMDGLTAVDTLRKDPKIAHIKVIFLSAKGQQSDRDRAAELGAAEFMAKPFSPKLLVEKIEALLA